MTIDKHLTTINTESDPAKIRDFLAEQVEKTVTTAWRRVIDYIENINADLNTLDKNSQDYKDYTSFLTNPIWLVAHYSIAILRQASLRLLNEKSNAKATLLDIYDYTLSIYKQLSNSLNAIGALEQHKKVQASIELMEESGGIGQTLKAIPDPIK